MLFGLLLLPLDPLFLDSVAAFPTGAHSNRGPGKCRAVDHRAQSNEFVSGAMTLRDSSTHNVRFAQTHHPATIKTATEVSSTSLVDVQYLFAKACRCTQRSTQMQMQLQPGPELKY